MASNYLKKCLNGCRWHACKCLSKGLNGCSLYISCLQSVCQNVSMAVALMYYKFINRLFNGCRFLCLQDFECENEFNKLLKCE